MAKDRINRNELADKIVETAMSLVCELSGRVHT